VIQLCDFVIHLYLFAFINADNKCEILENKEYSVKGHGNSTKYKLNSINVVKFSNNKHMSVCLTE